MNLKMGKFFLEAKIQNGCCWNDILNGLTHNDAQYMVSDLFFIKEYIFLVYTIIWPLNSRWLTILVILRDFLFNHHWVFILGSNKSAAHDELNNIQCKYTEIISKVNKVDVYV